MLNETLHENQKNTTANKQGLEMVQAQERRLRKRRRDVRFVPRPVDGWSVRMF